VGKPEQDLCRSLKMIRPKILIVDDDPRMLYVLEQALSTSDYDLVKANSGIHALSKLKSDIFALVLLDIKMSVIDGLTTARMIRNETRNRDVPIIFISGVNEKDLISTGYAMGAIDYILKPVDYHVLKSKVRFFADLYCRTEALRIAEEQLRRVRSELERALARQNELLQSLETRENLFCHLPEDSIAQVWLCGVDGLHNWDAIKVDPADVERCINAYTSAFDQRVPFHLKYRICCRNDSFRNILDTGVPRISPDGVFAGYIGSAVDLSMIEEQSISRKEPLRATTSNMQ
jgi:CheY-like chemotaxis protein